MSLLFAGDPGCPLCGETSCSTHLQRTAIGEGIGKEEPLSAQVPHHVVTDRVFRDGCLVHAAGDVIPRSEAVALGLTDPATDEPETTVEPTVEVGRDRRMRRLPEDRMAGRGMEDR